MTTSSPGRTNANSDAASASVAPAVTNTSVAGSKLNCQKRADVSGDRLTQVELAWQWRILVHTTRNGDARRHQPGDRKTHGHSGDRVGLDRGGLRCARVDQKAVGFFDCVDTHALQFVDHSGDAIGLLLSDEANTRDSGWAISEGSDRCHGLCGVTDLGHIEIDAVERSGPPDFDEVVSHGDIGTHCLEHRSQSRHRPAARWLRGQAIRIRPPVTAAAAKKYEAAEASGSIW
ncbi:hypothetical protein GQR58_029567 [Nymphon striatum]|nr:hypothetical protein GQR58_029567 [Nymphon striatum]